MENISSTNQNKIRKYVTKNKRGKHSVRGRKNKRTTRCLSENKPYKVKIVKRGNIPVRGGKLRFGRIHRTKTPRIPDEQTKEIVDCLLPTHWDHFN